jgi:uncharacterized YigZ family protein
MQLTNEEIEKTHYYTVDQASSPAEFKDRGSKFIAYAFPISSVEDCKKCLALLKKEHPKAVHHCYAYRIGVDGNNFRMVDDGEPSGSAGKPILGQIDSKELADVLIVVVRYFGGTLLGVPGLINAYKTAAALSLQMTTIVQKEIEVHYRLHFDYTLMNEVMMIVKQNDCSVIKQEMTLFCDFEIGIPKINLAKTIEQLKELHTLEINLMA